ncbi:hypothetical protein OGAPHI_001194 [Ogataea philodendri]|uniref:Uncharacterized protein n=1 Tax=Ogataea philodendri TaxID=1378263 RepID=A0A9P8PG74_9ASCO|nr:uncharacterized protein OGAPHI_001194 [Ogataea philodendri]KAH3670679.1 hypothetical protein OGAPHI_001194 [Ogataea philodendri]
MDAISGQNPHSFRHVAAQVVCELLLDLVDRVGRLDHLLGESRVAVVRCTPLVHLVHSFLWVVNHGLVAGLVDQPEVFVGDETADLYDMVVLEVESGHFTVDPDDGQQMVVFAVDGLQRFELRHGRRFGLEDSAETEHRFAESGAVRSCKGECPETCSEHIFLENYLVGLLGVGGAEKLYRKVAIFNTLYRAVAIPTQATHPLSFRPPAQTR